MRMGGQGWLSYYSKLLLLMVAGILLPIISHAQLISIAATSPFPATVEVGSTSSATYTVTNITSRSTITVIDQSNFPSNSGLSISGSTCGSPLAPGGSCTINLSLGAHTSPTTISTYLKEWAKPSADGVQSPINISVYGLYLTPSAGTGGSISPSTVQEVNYNSSFTFTGTANTGYRINEWLLDSVLAQTGGSTYTLSNITSAHTVEVTFIKTYDVTPSAGTGGSISPTVVDTVDTGGSSGPYTQTASTGYAFAAWLVNGVSVSTNPAPYTITGITQDTTIEATFIQTFTINASAGANGTISDDGDTVYNSGANATYTATPASNYEVDEWTVDGDVVQTGGTTYDFTNITADHTISVTFKTASGVLVAAGRETGVLPIVAVSSDAGANWATKTITSLVDNGIFEASSCKGSGATAVCVAGGQLDTNAPILAASTDSGDTWITKTPTGIIPAFATYYSTSCTGSDVTATCIAAGENQTDTAPFLVASTDGANNWVVQTITSAPTTGYLNGASCTGTTSTAICAVAGQDLDTNGPLVAVTTNGATSWEVKTITDAPATAIYNAVDCSGTGSTAICVAVGQEDATNPTMAISTDGASTWALKNIAGAPATGILRGVSCTGTESSAICATVGQQSGTAPFVAVSTDGANNWAEKTVTSIPAAGILYSASCTGTGATAICVAVGKDTTNDRALIVQSVDGGATWTTVTSPVFAAGSVFNATKCTGNDTTAVCSAAGGTATATYLASTLDGGTTWTVKTVTGAPVTGVFNSTGASGGTLRKE